MPTGKLILTALVSLCVLAACSAPATPVAAPAQSAPVQVEGGAYADINPAQLADMLKHKDFFFVNTHIPYEGEIEPTDAFIPFDQTLQSLDQYPSDKDAKIVLYCRSGRMSAIAAEELVKAGYTNVWNLKGGMIDWRSAGLPLKER